MRLDESTESIESETKSSKELSTNQDTETSSQKETEKGMRSTTRDAGKQLWSQSPGAAAAQAVHQNGTSEDSNTPSTSSSPGDQEPNPLLPRPKRHIIPKKVQLQNILNTLKKNVAFARFPLVPLVHKKV